MVEMQAAESLSRMPSASRPFECPAQTTATAECETVIRKGLREFCRPKFVNAINGRVRTRGHYEAHKQKLDHYLGVLSSKPYRYGIDFLPHDAKARELISGRSRVP